MAEVVAGKRTKLSDQVAQTIRQRTRTGEYKPGDTLPTVRAMSQEFGVSVNVIQRALLILENEKVVVSHPGRSVEICRTDTCDQTAILFGLIIPYQTSMFFASQVMFHAQEVFSQRHNFLVIKTSDDDPQKERQAAEHLINNGIQGLLVWPTSDNHNAKFFSEISEQIPIVFVDRRLENCNLPSVVEDYHSCGKDMIQFLFQEKKCHKVLALIDDLQVTSYQDFTAGLEDAAHANRDKKNLVIQKLPISKHIARWNRSDFSQVQQISDSLIRQMVAQKFDALICPHVDFLDYVFFQSQAAEQLQDRNLHIATIANAQTNTRSLKYNQGNVQEWMSGHAQMIHNAANMLQERILSKKRLLGRFEQITLLRRQANL